MFYFAWVDATDTTFGFGTRSRTRTCLSIAIAHKEGEIASLAMDGAQSARRPAGAGPQAMGVAVLARRSPTRPLARSRCSSAAWSAFHPSRKAMR
jgi:hypothetical protein